jgi:hypothetical protein
MRPETLPADTRRAMAAGLDVPVDADALDLSGFLAGAFGPATVAVLHYGSRAQGRKPRADSAFDFFVVVEDNAAAYRTLSERVGTSYRPGLAAWLGARLAPNVVAVKQPAAAGGRLAKCCVIALADLQHATSPEARDHFCHGRLMQVSRLTWVRDEAAASAVRDVIVSVRAHTFAWMGADLPESFDVVDYLVTALRRSLAGEIRPEVGDHARTLIESQRSDLEPPYRALLNALAAAGALRALDAQRFTVADPHAAWTPGRTRRYFRRSKARTTVRLFKHVVLYEGWLDYIVRKIERSGAGTIELTPRERRWPLIFLWPRFFKFVLTRPQRRAKGDNTRS